MVENDTCSAFGALVALGRAGSPVWCHASASFASPMLPCYRLMSTDSVDHSHICLLICLCNPGFCQGRTWMSTRPTEDRGGSSRCGSRTATQPAETRQFRQRRVRGTAGRPDRHRPEHGRNLPAGADPGAADVDAALRAGSRGLRDLAAQHSCRAQPGAAEVPLLDEARAEDLVGRVAHTGKPVALTRTDEVPPLADELRFFAGAARMLEGKSTGEYLRGHTSMHPPRVGLASVPRSRPGTTP